MFSQYDDGKFNSFSRGMESRRYNGDRNIATVMKDLYELIKNKYDSNSDMFIKSLDNLADYCRYTPPEAISERWLTLSNMCERYYPDNNEIANIINSPTRKIDYCLIL